MILEGSSMKHVRPLKTSRILFALLAAGITALLPPVLPFAEAQDPQVQQSLAEIKESAAKNKQALSHYSWQEQQTIAVKGDVKDEKFYQVHLGPDGKPQKVETENMSTSSAGRKHGLAHHIKEKKGEEYKEYGQQIAALAQQYAQPDPQKLQQAFQQGNVMFGSAGSPGEVKVVISNYVKPNDKVTLIFNRQAKAIQSLNIATYLNDPKDAVTIGAQYGQLQDGTNHVASTQTKGESKDLLVTTQNSNYQKTM